MSTAQKIDRTPDRTHVATTDDLGVDLPAQINLQGRVDGREPIQGT